MGGGNRQPRATAYQFCAERCTCKSQLEVSPFPLDFGRKGGRKKDSLYSFLLFFIIVRADYIDYGSFRADRYWSGNNGKARKSRTITLPMESAATAT